MEIATLPLSTIVPEVLGEYNYERWSILIEHYLVAQDVWNVVDPSQTTEERNDKDWTKKNALALHAIKISCGAKAFDLIKNKKSARDAWMALHDMQNVSVFHYCPMRHEFVPREMATCSEREQLHESICKGSKRRVERLVYHFLNFLNRSDQRILLKAALQVAITAGQEDIACFLYRKIPLEFLYRDYGFILLEECVTKKMFKIAWDLLNHFPELATEGPSQGYVPIILTLAKTPPPFFRRSQLKFVRLWIYHCIEVNVELIKPRPSVAADDASAVAVDVSSNNPSATADEAVVVDVSSNNPSAAADGALEEELSGYQSCLQFLMAQLRKLVTPLLKILAKPTYDLKSTDVYAHKVVSFLCERLRGLQQDQFSQNRAKEAIYEAIKNGIPDIVIEIEPTEKLLSTSASTHYKFLLTRVAYAIEHRQEEVAKYLYKYRADIFYDIDEDGNNNLHLVAKLAPHFQLDRISGAALQLQSELRWFKLVEAIVPRFYTEKENKNGETPYQVFVKEHKNLLKEAEEWMKRTAESSTVVGALIITIMFAAAFTVPGGNNQNTGFPIFLNTTAPGKSFTVTRTV